MKKRGWGPDREHFARAPSVQWCPITRITLRARRASVGLTRALASDFGAFRNYRECDLAEPDAISGHAVAHRARAGRASMDEEFAALAARASDPRNRRCLRTSCGTMSFLTSDDAAFVTGQTLYVDGGMVRA